MQGTDLLVRSNSVLSIQRAPKNWMIMMSHDVFLPKSFTIVASDCRGTTLLFKGVFVALGSRIIPEDTDISNHTFLQCGLDKAACSMCWFTQNI